MPEQHDDETARRAFEMPAEQTDALATIATNLERIAKTLEKVADMLAKPTVTPEPEPAPFAVKDRVRDRTDDMIGTILQIHDDFARVEWDPDFDPAPAVPTAPVTWVLFSDLIKIVDNLPNQDTNTASA